MSTAAWDELPKNSRLTFGKSRAIMMYEKRDWNDHPKQKAPMMKATKTLCEFMGTA